jgi:hypothetical protein
LRAQENTQDKPRIQIAKGGEINGRKKKKGVKGKRKEMEMEMVK